MRLAETILLLAGLYLAAGVVVGIAFVTKGLAQAFPHSGPVTVGAKILILPASVLLWPVVARRWMAGR